MWSTLSLADAGFPKILTLSGWVWASVGPLHAGCLCFLSIRFTSVCSSRLTWESEVLTTQEGCWAGLCPGVDLLWACLWRQAGFVSIGTVDILGQILCCWGCLVNWKIFSSIPGLYPLDASSTLSSRNNQTCLQTLSNIPQGDKITPGWEPLSSGTSEWE